MREESEARATLMFFLVESLIVFLSLRLALAFAVLNKGQSDLGFFKNLKIFKIENESNVVPFHYNSTC